MRTVSTRTLLLIGLLVALTLAGVVSFYASGSPDGLNRVAADLGFAEAEQASGANGGPLAGYEVAGVDHARWSGGVAGALGCLVVLAVSSLLLLLRQRSPLHGAPAHLKVAGLVCFMLLVVATPVAFLPAFVAYAAALAVLVAVSGVPVPFLARRMVVETPVLVFAAFLPFVAAGPQVELLGLSVSEAGLTAGGGLVMKATLGVMASLLLAATTDRRDLLVGLERLRVPVQLVQIMGFMLRYLDVVSDELRRMRTARESRGFTARDPRHWPVIGRSAGALFIRSFERGERVHLAMVSRGYDGSVRR